MNIEAIYEEAGALLKGHFLLSSGNHSGFYLQSAKVLENPKTCEKLSKALADMIRAANIEASLVCAPALGGVIAGYELARALGARSIFAERENGVMTLRRGFAVAKGQRVIVCEDIITTGGSAMETADLIEAHGGVVAAFAALANRGFCRREGGINADASCKLDANVPLFALADFAFPVYAPDRCPLCAAHGKPIKPGSRPTSSAPQSEDR
ncbi:MAG: orotate phosphoribosyltransferase [Helicobacteraceae bacterium]|jgi:orotate phosphoribosyltransferase|nr:orotate phosphoribosyltransferase [Helicobacteraceae bacterium]